jgi:hypothetical protein
MLGGQPWAEDRLLSLVAAYQSVTDWHTRRPPQPADIGPGDGSAGSFPDAPARAARRAPSPGERGRTTVWEVMAEGE